MKQLDLFAAINAAPAARTNTLRHLLYCKLGQHKNAGRIWLEGRRLADVGFVHGVRYQATVANGALLLRLTPAGDRVVSGKADRPIIDMLTHELGAAERIEVRFLPDEIRVAVHPVDRAAGERLERLNQRLQSGEALRLGSLCHGGGITSDALTRGLRHAGVASEFSFGLEINPIYLEQSLAHNPLWTAGSLSVEGSIDEVAVEVLPRVEILEAGLPCTAASRAGRAKKGTAFAEQDAKLAHLVYGFLRIIEATQPAVVVLENVVEYASTASAAIIRGQLDAWGYTVHEARLDGEKYALEARPRLALVAVTRGAAFDISLVEPVEERPAVLGEILETVADDDQRWRTYDYLHEKELRDAEDGKSFAGQTVTPESTRIPTLRRGYAKGGSTDPRLLHPTEPGLSRLLTVKEHAACKGVPAGLVDGMSTTVAHQVLGQAIVGPAFSALATTLVRQLLRPDRMKV